MAENKWGKTANNVANTPNWAVAYVNKSVNNATNQTNLSGNVSVGAWLNGATRQLQQVGVFGVSAATLNTGGANVNSEANRINHTGWNLRRGGTGPVKSAKINVGGSSYCNLGSIKFVATGTGSVNATGLITTNSTGGITAVTMDPPPYNTPPGFGINGVGAAFINVSNTTVTYPANSMSNSTGGSALTLTNGAGFTNGDLIVISNGTINALVSITANATGNTASATLVRGGAGFVNATAIAKAYFASDGASPAGNAVASATVSVGGTTYGNTDVITFSNGVTNATANPVTNSTGGITSVTMLTYGRGFPGATNVAIAFANATGGASGGSGATLAAVMSAAPTLTITVNAGATANIVPVLGGRAGRVHYETLVALVGISGPAVVAANSTFLPSS